ncbi:MAG TPA: Hpt domain-containing protein [Bdellovibrionales bacterium]|nr:Hpt domain-containing protein [Bdellovibrionales bacterium]
MSLQDVLAGLQKSYLASMPEKVARIEALYAAQSLKELQSEYHKLKGTGKTYGIPEVTLLGAAMEQLCMTKPGELKSMVTVSIRFLNDISAARGNGTPYDIEAQPDFQSLVTLIGGLKLKADA